MISTLLRILLILRSNIILIAFIIVFYLEKIFFNFIQHSFMHYRNAFLKAPLNKSYL